MKNYSHQTSLIAEDPLKKGIFWGTGSGKTRTALQLARGRTLVICPKTQRLDRTWERELEKLDGNHHVDELVVLSKEDFKKRYTQMGYFDTLIGDEAHTLCGVTPNTRSVNKVRVPKASQIFEAMDWFIQNIKPSRIYIVTATPIPQPMAVWGAARLLGVTYDFVKFRAAFYTRVNIRGRELWLPKKDSKSKDTLASVVRKIGVTGRLEDWFDVPPQTFKTISVGMTREQEAKVHELGFLYPDPLVRIGKIHQLEQGIFEGEFIPQNKFEALDDLIEEFGRVLVFCKYTMQINELDAYLKKKIKTLVLTGATKDRRQLMVDAEKSDRCVVIAQAQISAGYELPSYRCTVFISKSYSYVDWDQALGRTLRANNLQRNLYVTIHAGEVDEAVTDSVANKKDFSERIYAEKRGFIYDETAEVGEEEYVTPLSDRGEAYAGEFEV